MNSWGDYPRLLGNMFSFRDWLCVCTNINAENMTEATKRFLPDNMVEIKKVIIGDVNYAFVSDPRIPTNWYSRSLSYWNVPILNPEEEKHVMEFWL